MIRSGRGPLLWALILPAAALRPFPSPLLGETGFVSAVGLPQASPEREAGTPAGPEADRNREAGSGPGSSPGTGLEASPGRAAREDSIPHEPESPEGLFETGNRLYQENDFNGALTAYLGVLEAGYESSDLHYNLGNAYFKTGDLGRSILSWERALRMRPGDSDTRANLELARSLTADEIEPLPRFWLLSALSWWVNLLPQPVLVFLVVFTYLLITGGLCLFILSRRRGKGRLGAWVSLGGVAGGVLFGVTLLARTGALGGSEWGVILEEAVPVQSAPSSEADLTLFLVHEGTKVRIDQTSETWLEVVLEDGKVGWVPVGVLEII